MGETQGAVGKRKSGYNAGVSTSIVEVRSEDANLAYQASAVELEILSANAADDGISSGTLTLASAVAVTPADGTVICASVLPIQSADGTVTLASALAIAKATGTITCVVALAGDTVTVNGLVYTAVAGAKANNTEFSIDTGNNETAADLADSITNDTRTGTLNDVTATSSTNVVTCQQTVGGAGGNATTLASSSDAVRLVISGATFANGVDADTVTVNGLVYTAVAGAKANNTEFSIDTSDNAAATDLAASITADARTPVTVPSIDQTAVAVGAVVTITASTPGTGGNSIDLSSSNGTRLAVSGAFLAGGAAADTVTVNGLVYTAVAGAKANNTQFSTDTSDNATATDLADSIENDARTGVTVPSINLSASAAVATVTIVADTPGTGGNAIDLASSNGTRLAVSAAFLDGGLNADVATVNGLTYTGVAGVKANNTQFSVDTSDTAAALDLKNSINADTRTPVTVPSVKVVASSAVGVVTIDSNIGGTVGDTIDISGTSNITASGATLTDVGTGARSVVIEGLDGNYNEISETVFLNGATPVVLVNDYLRVNNAYVDESGSGLVNAGLITIRVNAGDVTQLIIPAGQGRGQSTNLTVGLGKSISLKELDITVSQVAANAVVVQVQLWKKLFGESWQMFDSFSFANGGIIKNYNDDEFEFPQKTDLKITALKIVGTGDATVEVGYSYREYMKV